MKLKEKNYKIGDCVSEEVKVTLEMIEAYAKASGDYNPIHLDKDYAEKSFLGGRVTHGLFCLGIVSKLVATELPGEGSVLVNEHINYRLPVYIDDVITTSLTVIELNLKKNFLELEIKCTNQKGKIVLDGSTLVKLM